MAELDTAVSTLLLEVGQSAANQNVALERYVDAQVPVACSSKQWPVDVAIKGKSVMQDARGRDVTVRLTHIRVSPAATAATVPLRCTEG